MTMDPELSFEERAILEHALEGPLTDHDPVMLGVCLCLCGRKLLQRAGAAAAVNGWRGSPHAFMLTREGWTLLKTDRRGPSARRRAS